MDSLIFELQIVFYFHIFLSANVRHTYVIASAKEIDALNITLFNSCINSTNVHLCNYCTKIFVIIVNTCVCRRSVDNKALILSYPIPKVRPLIRVSVKSRDFHTFESATLTVRELSQQDQITCSLTFANRMCSKNLGFNFTFWCDIIRNFAHNLTDIIL